MSKIRKVVIPVAGFGTRFLPVTKAMPKEMMPIIDKPVIQYVVEEAVDSGITDIILVTGASKRAVEDHFDYNYELQAWLKKQGKEEIRERIKKIADMANFTYIRQKGPYGNGTPVLNAEHVIGDEPFAVVWGDEFFTGGKKPRLKQLIDVYEKYEDIVLTGMRVDAEGTRRFGIVDPVAEVQKDVWQVKGIVEKPGPKEAKSDIGAIGGYILPPDIFQALKNTKRGKAGEVWLVDAISKLSKDRPMYVKIVDGVYRDTGTKKAWLKTNIALALQDKDLKTEMRKFIKSLL
ncbi:UTP--glucose-1-phosphate uridylyltransferase [Candidatus Uhrbacteria bacterium CG_4_9_14_0_2_um_filter_41_50]|uniref:UTP--glucose-1-phosphate uridylyltransferase n=1 Tax=Candidatus Uhrbacteria bacterium CG_4_9_14_0_2_um_filter_41_50 TaxID=1975031 RepID=A0A2M8EP60_9BACT|nr:MAG: UTP--glucose-1-phosphate uridylyltransferase [Candidatus Uhrbacteria bacterium CG_4_10_14_3_um_filter_41_21]PIZ55456.1 MAG: UTP--glucose-1-phosphate uridylyltransferase [Candidatus Uhrbacteria bacterium CG_4_10_14_0_2_um_filter_41_21]PJB84637.1 MAG: UTP--glucose-1-phosphate uridylyltransferase [Candidatus Uhrbacteria bacterium CG_4_9_14_0_8_um_filter_41_16]PJC24534.1 MAG: UTP--glucose-1-phosphate uridylyltransferase [Candidatus Uhrbacteria bacterium CG_4_9_14_0_2_um_filter_41_50]PJE7538